MTYAVHVRCPLSAMNYDGRGATCAACGQRWVRDRWGYALAATTRPAWAASL